MTDSLFRAGAPLPRTPGAQAPVPRATVPQAPVPRGVVLWLVLCAAMVFAMTVIGAITRLTESGLSMVEWRPLIGTIPPLSEAEWQRVFALYRETPQFHQVFNGTMTMEQFQEIFFWEWFHRFWGRLIGLVFAVPFVWFLIRGSIPAWCRPHLWALLALGAAQAVMGWYMVESGLVDRPTVSQYRLAAHLGLALVIYAYMVLLILRLVGWPRRNGADRTAIAAEHVVGVQRWGHTAFALTAVTILWGAFVAGLDAGHYWNSWPLMGGQVFPPDAWDMSPLWLNAFDNPGMVQFIHRWVAIVAAAAVIGYAAVLWRHADSSRLAALLAAAVLAQVLLGILTLLYGVPIILAALHQAGAVVLLTLLIAAWMRVRAARTTADRSPVVIADAA